MWWKCAICMPQSLRQAARTPSSPPSNSFYMGNAFIHYYQSFKDNSFSLILSKSSLCYCRTLLVLNKTHVTNINGNYRIINALNLVDMSCANQFRLSHVAKKSRKYRCYTYMFLSKSKWHLCIFLDNHFSMHIFMLSNTFLSLSVINVCILNIF